MYKDDWIYIEHMLDMSKKALDAVKGKSRKNFDNDLTLQMALTHFIQIIGEAARRVSPVSKQAYPEIPWQQIIWMRHRIVHDYMRVDEDVVWEVATNDLPALVSLLEVINPPKENI